MGMVVLRSATTSLMCLGGTLDDISGVMCKSSTKVPHHIVHAAGCCQSNGIVVASTWIHASITRQLTQVPHDMYLAVHCCPYKGEVAISTWIHASITRQLRGRVAASTITHLMHV